METVLFQTVLSQAAETKYHRWGGLKNRHLFLTVLEAARSETNVLADSVLDENLRPDLQTSTCSLCPHLAERELSLSLSSYEATNPNRRALMTSPDPNYLPKAKSPKPSLWGQGFNVWIWRVEGNTIQSKAETKAGGTKGNHGKIQFEQIGCRTLVWISSRDKMSMYLQELLTHSMVHLWGCHWRGSRWHTACIRFRTLHMCLFTCSINKQALRDCGHGPAALPSPICGFLYTRVKIAGLSASWLNAYKTLNQSGRPQARAGRGSASLMLSPAPAPSSP